MKKRYVLDTNILLYDAQAIFKFEDNDVIIPLAVIEEIDQFKKDVNETGRNARQVSRYLDELRKKAPLTKGIDLENGGRLFVDQGESKQVQQLTGSHKREADSMILAVGLAWKAKDNGIPTVLVTKDVNLRIRADALGLAAEDYEATGVELEELYSGHCEIEVEGELIDELYRRKEIPWSGEANYPNQMVLLRDKNAANHSALGKIQTHRGKIVTLREVKEGLWGIFPKNKEQCFAVDLLMDDEVQLVTLVGKAGTGKTLLALAAGLNKVADENIYHRLLVSRPVFPLGRDIGYLPGDIEEKLLPWMQPIFDNVEFIMGSHEKGKKRTSSYHYKELINMGMLSIEPLTYIRGRSIPNQYLIIDEAQNLTPHEIKTIISRAGHGTKVVVTGDPYQIDNPYVDSSNNGLTFLVDRFQREKIAGHITLVKGERSNLAELAANLL